MSHSAQKTLELTSLHSTGLYYLLRFVQLRSAAIATLLRISPPYHCSPSLLILSIRVSLSSLAHSSSSLCPMLSIFLRLAVLLLLSPLPSTVFVSGWMASGSDGYLVSNNILINGSISVMNSTSSQPIDLLQVIVQMQQQFQQTLATMINTLNAQIPPVGAVIAFAGTPPSISNTNWLLCDGSVYNISRYPFLYQAIGSSHGSPTPGVTFRVPDYRGWFLRGVDGGAGVDPDASSRNSSAVGGASGNVVGSAQLDSFGAHDHAWQDPGHTHTLSDGTGWVDRGYETGFVGWDLANPSNFPSGVATSTATTGIQFDTQGGRETRAKNKYVNYLIRCN